MSMKRGLFLLSTICLVAVFCLGGSALAQDQKKINIAWGGSSPGGVMYYMVGTAGNIISRDLPQYNITQVSTGGSTENTKRLLKGELDMGICYGAHVYLALKQEAPFKNFPKGDMLKGVAKAYAGPTYFITRPSTGIKTLSDLKGKTVALGPPGSGTVFNCSNILRAVGMLDQVKPRMMTFADAGRAMANNQIDAFCQSSAPAAAVKELAETKGAFVLPINDEEFDKVMKKYPFYSRVEMPEGTYKGRPGHGSAHADRVLGGSRARTRAGHQGHPGPGLQTRNQEAACGRLQDLEPDVSRDQGLPGFGRGNASRRRGILQGSRSLGRISR